MRIDWDAGMDRKEHLRKGPGSPRRDYPRGSPPPPMSPRRPPMDDYPPRRDRSPGPPAPAREAYPEYR